MAYGIPWYPVTLFLDTSMALDLVKWNYGAAFITALLIGPFFYTPSTYPYEWFTYPAMNIAGNMLFWYPVAFIIDKLISRFPSARSLTK